jgi:uncharacterized protein
MDSRLTNEIASMLHRLEIENFYSIRDPQIIDLRAAGNAPDEPGRLVPIWRGAPERAPKVVALFGANASGKSNVLKALSFLAWFAADSFQAGSEDWLPFMRFGDDTAQDMPTRLAIHFSGPVEEIGWTDSPDALQCRYAYEVSFGGPKDRPPQVLSETLRYWPPDAGRQVRLFDRSAAGAVSAGGVFGIRGYYRRALETVLRPNASAISTLTGLNHPFSTLLGRELGAVYSNILTEKQDMNEEGVARYFARNPNHLTLLNREFERLGLGVRAMRLPDGAGGPVAWFEHEGLTGLLPPRLESHGTRQFVKVFPLIAQALEIGGVAVIDELDLAIHPLVLPEIIRWFHDPQRNPRDAQLWLTCQNASLLEDLTKEEVLFCEKDSRGRTTVYGLGDVQAVRRDDNYYRKYLGGVYGAVPHLG